MTRLTLFQILIVIALSVVAANALRVVGAKGGAVDSLCAKGDLFCCARLSLSQDCRSFTTSRVFVADATLPTSLRRHFAVR